jgi:hypothetical protein
MARNPFSSAYRFAILALPLLAYFAFQTKNYYWDGVAFAIDIEKRTNLLQLLHPNHLIYSLWGAALQSMLGGPPIRAREAMQAANAACAGLAVLLMYALLRRSTPPDTAVWGSLLFGFSATWWRFASDANAYIPATTLLLATVVTLRPERPFSAAFWLDCCMRSPCFFISWPWCFSPWPGHSYRRTTGAWQHTMQRLHSLCLRRTYSRTAAGSRRQNRISKD